ncbi:MAG TPA: AmmeMemoRadiSam system radical SAM enzyme [Candidatus Omnitrophota bacterium]|nr:AmmeMemoRadiSam system radical SAM enzyme [Candidatus Omnitrophota bacterium]
MKKLPGLLFLCALCLASVIVPVAAAENPAREASFYEKLSNNQVQCHLCPWECVLSSGKRGICGVRENRTGTLYSLSYGQPVSLHIDPIEKKPLFHFLPGANAFSIATAGCNLKCGFCQNWEISQARPEEIVSQTILPSELVDKVQASGAYVLAYTYTEPTVFYEYMLEIAALAKGRGIRNVMHSNGFIQVSPLEQLTRYLDAANIDLKGFSEDYYKRTCQGRLAPVLESLKVLRRKGVHLEITNLVLPGYNDDPAQITRMCLWIKENLGAETPVHFSRFHPMYKLIALQPTPVQTLERARQIAMDCGLKYVYIGNVPGHPAENTYCPRCRKKVIERAGYIVSAVHLKAGACSFCNEPIEGVWE